MRKAALLLLFLLVSVIHYGQTSVLNKLVNLELTNLTKNQAIDELAKAADVDISYSKNFFDPNDLITINVVQTPVKTILDEILTNTQITYKLSGNNRILLYQIKEDDFVLSGFVSDKQTGEKLLGAKIIDNATGNTTLTNEYGHYSLTLTGGKQTLTVKFVGYKTLALQLELKENTKANFAMDYVEDLPLVLIDGRADAKQVLRYEVALDENNIVDIAPQTANVIPSLNGANDFVRVVQILPGVQTQSDGFGGINIRGSESGQNLMYLDGAPVYIPYHLLGLYGVYNPTTIQSVKVVKGNAPAHYGGAVSSILDVNTKEGDLYKWRGNAGVNLLNASLQIEGPLKPGKGSILIAGRYSPIAYFYQPTLSRLYFNNQTDDLATSFYDLNIKTNYKLNQKHHIYGSFYTSNDVIYQTALTNIDQLNRSYTNFDLNWSNTIGSVRWNFLVNDRLFLNTTVTYSNYSTRFSSQDEFLFENDFGSSRDLFVIDNRSTNNDFGIKVDIDYNLNKKQHLRFGVQHNVREFLPQFYFLQNTSFDADNSNFGEDAYDYNGYYETTVFPIYKINESAVYIEDHIKFKRFYFNLGARLSYFTQGTSDYLNIEPRLLAQYKATEKTIFSLAVNRRMQYLHLIANQSLQLPNNLWIPAKENIKPQELYEAELSVIEKITPNVELNATAYYRLINNIYAYPETFDFLFSTVDYSDYDYLVNGQANNYGLEFYANYSDQKKGILITYTLSKATRQFDSLNLGLTYAANIDSRHQIKLAFHHAISKSFKVGLNWVFNSPQPQINVLSFSSSGNFTNINQDPIGQKNTTRSNSYNRIDLNIQYHYTGKKLTHAIQFGVYNLLNSANTAFHEVQYIDVSTNEVISNPLKSLPILPSFSYQITF